MAGDTKMPTPGIVKQSPEQKENNEMIYKIVEGKLSCVRITFAE